MHAHPVGDVDRLVRVVDPTCTCTPKISSWRAMNWSAGDQVAVARARDDPLVLPHGERVRAGRADRQAEALGGRLDAPAQLAELTPGLPRVAARLGRDLADRLHELGLDGARLADRLQERLDRIGELERLRVHDHQLLFDADGVRGARESVLHGAHRRLRGTRNERGWIKWHSATTASSTSSLSTIGGRSRRSGSASRAIPRPRTPSGSPTPSA